MTPHGGVCPVCGQRPADPGFRFCPTCGAALAAPTPARPISADATMLDHPVYSSRLLNTVRLLAAGSMLTGILAIARFDSATLTGRLLAMLAILTAASGQVFVTQAVKPHPPPWATVPLTLLWIGISALLLAWTVALSR